MPFVEIKATQIYYEIHGEGDAVVLLHHGFGGTRMWNDIALKIADAGYQVVRYDRRGFGRSAAGEDFEAFYASNRYRPESVQEMAGLMAELKIKSFHVVGQCEGGVIGCDYAAAYPRQVKSLVLASVQSRSQIPMRDVNRQKFPEPFRNLDPPVQKKMSYFHGPERAAYLYDLIRICGGAYGCGPFDLSEVLAWVICPTLVLYPDRSGLFDVEQGVEIYRHLTNGELAVLPNCGHNSYECNPDEYVRIVLDFFYRHGF